MPTDRELLEMALDDLDWAKAMLKLDGTDSHECVDDVIAAITKRLENKDG